MRMVQFCFIASIVLLLAFVPKLPANQGTLLADLFSFGWVGLGILIVLANAKEWVRLRKRRKILEIREKRKRFSMRKKLARSI